MNKDSLIALLLIILIIVTAAFIVLSDKHAELVLTCTQPR